MGKGKYQDWLTHEGLTKLEGWARDGLTDEQIANNIGIRRPTLYDWKKSHPDISDALKKGKEVVDREVESALLKRAKDTRLSRRPPLRMSAGLRKEQLLSRFRQTQRLLSSG